MANLEKATLAAGCFWGVEEVFSQTEGVVETRVGYTGGHKENPTYKEVCNADTGHAEAVELFFDKSKITFEKILDIFWEMHDPTTLNRQGPDVGPQYRSAVYFHSDEQKTTAEKSKSAKNESGKFSNPIVTEITEASTFYAAEDYHQKYFEKQGKSCRI